VSEAPAAPAPIARRIAEFNQPKRWTIEGLEGLYVFRRIVGNKPKPREDAIVARFETNNDAGFTDAYFTKCQTQQKFTFQFETAKIPVKRCVVSGQQHFRVSWGNGWQCFPGEEWTEEMETEAREVLKKKRITMVEFVFD
jgi:hypothetical protein